MKPGMALTASLIAICSLAFTAQAAPPEGKGPGANAGNSGNKGNGGKGGPDVRGNKGSNSNGGMDVRGNKGNSGKGEPRVYGNQDKRPDTSRAMNSRHDDNVGRRYDDRGRHYDYFDDRRDHRRRGDSSYGNLLYAGITAALARDYAHDYGLSGYSSLPPGIRKNLARGKPLPPGIAKKMVPGSMLGRLPRYDGYEWRIAGTDLVLISLATAVVADILYDVFD